MSLLLRTFGTLELLDATGAPLLGAAAQRMPLLILSLAALHRDGIPRERLMKALWPGVAKGRARAVLKQHLYALRRATGRPNLLSGSPRLKVTSDGLRVDAWELAEHIHRGRLREAVEILNGELLESISTPDNPELAAIISELREVFSTEVAMVHAAISARPPAAPPPSSPEQSPHLLALRGVQAAANRFVRGFVTLPADTTAAEHRAAACVYDLLEALRDAELAKLPEAVIGDAIADVRDLSSRSALISTIQHWPRGHPGDSETLEWLVDGTVRSSDPIGRALESHLLTSPVAARYRTELRWQLEHLTSLPADRRSRVLLVGAGGAAAFGRLLPLLSRSVERLVLIDADGVALALARHRLAPLGERGRFIQGDCFREIADITEHAPYDLILVSGLYDGLADRQAAWLTERLSGMLGDGGRLFTTFLESGHSFRAWTRYVLGWELIERNQEDIVLLYGHTLRTGTLHWEADSVGMLRGVTFTRTGAGVVARKREAA